MTPGREPVGGPRAAGYLVVPAHASDTDTEAEAEAEVSAWRRVLAAHAAQRGLQLGAVFTDVRGRTESGVYRLVEHLRAGRAVAVVVPRLRQREVAERAGIARTTLAVLEGERRRVTIDDLDALCVGLDCTLADLLDGADRDVLRRLGLR